MGRDLFDENDESENEVTFKKSSEYSKKYDTLRRKEEILKLKNKYGDVAGDDYGDSSSSEDVDDVTFSEEFEKNFFRTLSCLKTRDPRIYDSKTSFFDGDSAPMAKSSQNKKEKPLTIRDYNREMVLNNNVDNDEEDAAEPTATLTYVEEQERIKKSFRNLVNDAGDSEEVGIGGLFSKKKKTQKEEEEEEESYRSWLSGQVTHLKNDKEESDLKPLKDYWSNPKLDKNEAFLRDYVLNQRFKEHNDSYRIPSYDEIVNQDDDYSEDERVVGQQTEFEHKFNFRFEEPDQDFIKRYPRTLEQSVRRKDDKRSKKRSEIRERKADEKKRKKEEISQLKSLKLKEIQEKIIQLKEITGNDQLAFDPEDLEDDFDPDAHDKKMKELFDENYYGETVDSKKPKFPDLDDEMEIENWDSWDHEKDVNNVHEPHCEDEDFNMDCDFDPKSVNKQSLLEDLKDSIEGTKKKRKKRNKLSDALSKEKPVYDPKKLKQTFSQYLDEYYKLDCEDVIGDMPCRFKYREVPACDYGLSVEEILMADDAELNRWYPIKKTLQYRPDHLQHNDQKVYSRKAKDINLKKKFFPSLFKENANEDVAIEGINETNDTNVSKSKKKKKNKKKSKNNKVSNCDNNKEITEDKTKKTKKHKIEDIDNNQIEEGKESKDSDCKIADAGPVKRKKRKLENIDNNQIEEKELNHSGNNEIADAQPIKRKKPKLDHVDNKQNETSSEVTIESNGVEKRKKKKKKNKNKSSDVINGFSVSESTTNFTKTEKTNDKHMNRSSLKHSEHGKLKKSNGSKLHRKAERTNDLTTKLTDERLKAFGLNPKKYRSFMKFKKY